MILLKNLKESFIATTCIMAICLSLFLFQIIPFNKNVVIAFSIGSVLLIFGQALFLLGAEKSLIIMGKKIGSHFTKFKSLFFVLMFGFIFGFASTIAEPDVSLFVHNLIGLNIPNIVLFVAFGLGVGCFVVFGLLRVIKNVPLKYIITAGYAIILVLSIFCPNFIGISLDAGGVTTGPITSPFLLAIIIGLSAIKTKKSNSDSFGMLAISTIGAVIALMIVGICIGDTSLSATSVPDTSFAGILVENIKSVAIVLAPITLLFFIINFISIKLSKKEVIKILIGLVFSYIGLVLFLTGVNFGFSLMATYIGENILALSKWAQYLTIVIFGIVLGFAIVFAEPAINIFAKQVDEVSSGYLSKRRIVICMAIGVALAVAISLVRVLVGISIWWIITPLIVLCCALTFFIPQLFTGISFDSGGVASGTMAVAFILPLANSLATSSTDGYGVIGIIALCPILSLQILSLIYKYKSRQNLITEQKNAKRFYKNLDFMKKSSKSARASAKVIKRKTKYISSAQVKKEEKNE